MENENLIKNILSIPVETQNIEFKRLGGSRNEGVDRTLQSIVAMANTDGGTIILGVDDPEKTTWKGTDRIFGIEENLELYDEIGKSVRKIYPPISDIWPPIIIKVAENKRITLLSIPKVRDGFRHIENRVYVRLEKGNKMLGPQEILHLAYVKGFSRADKELVDINFDLLKTNFYESWRKKRGLAEDKIELILEKTGLARKKENNKLLPTMASVLLFAEFPNDILDSKCSVRVFQYEGKLETVKETLNLIGTPRNINGPVAKQIVDTHEYVLSLLRSGMRIPSGFVTTYSIPERAVKEAITNAVIHRDYHTKRDIEIKIFEDCIEVESPGLLPFNITPSNIGIERSQEYRNDLLVKHLREFPDPPNLDQNEGVKAMRYTMKTANLYPPIFWTYPNLQDAVRVILLNEKAPNEWDKVSDYLIKNKYITNTEARGILLTDDTVKVSKRFNRWVRRGLLTKITPRTGAKRNVRYRLPTADEKTLFTNDKSK